MDETTRNKLIDETERALAGARRGARWNREQLAEYLEERYTQVGVKDPRSIARQRARTALDFAASVKAHVVTLTAGL